MLFDRKMHLKSTSSQNICCSFRLARQCNVSYQDVYLFLSFVYMVNSQSNLLLMISLHCSSPQNALEQHYHSVTRTIISSHRTEEQRRLLLISLRLKKRSSFSIVCHWLLIPSSRSVATLTHSCIGVPTPCVCTPMCPSKTSFCTCLMCVPSGERRRR